MPRSTRTFVKVKKSHINNTKKCKSAVEVRLPQSSNLIPSASSKKLSTEFVLEETKSDSEQCSGFRFIDISILDTALRNACSCAKCGGRNIKLVSDVKNEGVVSVLHIVCDDCSSDSSFKTSKRVPKHPQFYEANIRLAYGMRCLGIGREGAHLLCGVMNMPPPASRFTVVNKLILQSTKVVGEECMRLAANEAVEANSDNEVPTDISVSCDTTWMKRGHTSLYGVSTVISVDTGRVLDFEIKSKYCQTCVCRRKLHNVAKEREWQEQHRENCSKNYTGSSGGMEACAMKDIFGRSVAKHGVRYVKYLGDGDSSAFKQVSENVPYGTDVSIEKLECVGHIQKRMGGRLLKLTKEMKGKMLEDGKPLGGLHRLTKKEINSFQTYYGKAIRDNVGSLGNMERAVWAIYYHRLSTDAEHHHGLCPDGLDTWCGFKKAKLSKQEYKHKHSLPVPVMSAIKPTFQFLANPDLLKKCLHGGTQNANESFNNLIWKWCPKTKFVSKIVVELGTYDAIVVFNNGNKGRAKIIQHLGLDPGVFGKKIFDDIDNQRIVAAEASMKKLCQEARQEKRVKRKQTEDEEEAEEYGYGQF